MKIINTIYSEHLTNDNTPEAELKAAAARCGEAQEAIIRELYPDAEIETVINHGVSGVGAGVQVIDDETDGDEVAGRISDILAHEADKINDLTWAA